MTLGKATLFQLRVLFLVWLKLRPLVLWQRLQPHLPLIKLSCLGIWPRAWLHRVMLSYVMLHRAHPLSNDLGYDLFNFGMLRWFLRYPALLETRHLPLSLLLLVRPNLAGISSIVVQLFNGSKDLMARVTNMYDGRNIYDFGVSSCCW